MKEYIYKPKKLEELNKKVKEKKKKKNETFFQKIKKSIFK